MEKTKNAACYVRELTIHVYCFFRVCKDWRLIISRKAAPFLRTVAISAELFFKDIFWSGNNQARRFWSFAEGASTLAVVGTANWNFKSSWLDLGYPITRLWECYREQSFFNNSPLRINKVIYANMDIHSNAFRCSAVLRAGFQTTLYESGLTLPLADIFRFYYDEGNYVSPTAGLTLEVVGPDTYTLNAADLEETEKHGINMAYDSATEHFARKNCSHLEEYQLRALSKADFFEHFGSAEEVRMLVEQLINKLGLYAVSLDLVVLKFITRSQKDIILKLHEIFQSRGKVLNNIFPLCNTVTASTLKGIPSQFYHYMVVTHRNDWFLVGVTQRYDTVFPSTGLILGIKRL